MSANPPSAPASASSPSIEQTITQTATDTLSALAPVLLASASSATQMQNPTVAVLMSLLPIADKLLTANQMTPADLKQLIYSTQQEAQATGAQLDQVLANSPTKP